MDNKQTFIRWDHHVALITNRFVLFDLLKILSITYLLIVILFFILVTLFDSWRSVARLHCTPEQYPEIEAQVRHGLQTGVTEREKANRKQARA